MKQASRCPEVRDMGVPSSTREESNVAMYSCNASRAFYRFPPMAKLNEWNSSQQVKKLRDAVEKKDRKRGYYE